MRKSIFQNKYPHKHWENLKLPTI